MAIAKDPQSPSSTDVAERTAPADTPAAAGKAHDQATGRAGAEHQSPERAQAHLDLSEPERRLLDDLFAIVSEHAADSAVEIDRGRVQDAFVFACEHHPAQRRKRTADFLVLP